MVDINNLNRVKGILSARNGAEIPKFHNGAKFAMYGNNQTIYSPDGSNWFLDPSLTQAYAGSLAGFKSIQVPTQNGSMSSAGVTQITTSVTTPTVTPTVTSTVTPTDTTSLNASSTSTNLSEINTQVPEITAPILSIGVTPVDTGDPIKAHLEKSAGMNLTNLQENQRVGAVVGAIGNVGSDLLNAVGDGFAAKQITTDSNITKGADTAYNAIADGAANFGPYGKIVSVAMKAAGAAGNVIQELGGGTDQQTTTDKWMDSAFFSWNIGMLNGFAGKNSDSFGVDKDVLMTVGSSYGGTTSDIQDAVEKSGKKYGLFSSAARKKANEAIAKAKSQQNLMGSIADAATDQRLAVQSMGEQAGLTYSMLTGGGYDQKYTYAAKHGGTLEWEPNVTLDWEPTLEWEPQVELNWELPKFKEGGNVDIVEELEWIPEFKSGSKIRTIEELIEYAKKKNPRFIQRLSEEPRGIKFIDDEGNDSEGSHYLESRGEYVIPRIQEINGELKFLSPQEAIDRAMESGNYLKMSPEEAIIFAEQYKQGWPEFFKKFKKGGSVGDPDVPEIEETVQKNVIPEGALHKNKHHMEHAEGLTKKGIPVIDDDGEQQAEIEHSEIIFTLEVTKKLEEYYDIFYSDESSNKDKEQAALEAGQLLVYQILENTEDRTGLIDSCKKGGTLTLKKSTDDLIEEVLEWGPTVVLLAEEKEEVKNKSEKDLLKDAIKEVLIELLTK